jgi:ferric-dicitrate binding protein FerR (iron transport regulator)
LYVPAKKTDAGQAFRLWCSLSPESREEFAELVRMHQKVAAQAAKPKAKEAA